ncbi:MFS transporter [Arthrobacter sp. H20]|uniref:MFS transporter n=1 Tax=Arthrobacter sp. H20 TaxID=1267981 RepID=UPI00047AF35C|nr:MFS transporter [Arthrobacter sp. H20]
MTTLAVSGSRLGRYGRLPALAGPSFLTIGFFARLPLAMLTVGALTLVTAGSESVATGGFAAGAVGVGSALGAPILGYLADRTGQRPVLLISAILNTAAIALVVTASYTVPDFSAASTALILASAFGMGLTCPQIGPLARVRWIALTRGTQPGDLDTALSYESTADELTFVLGPALVGLLASLITPWLPLALAAILTIVMVSAFAVHHTVQAVVPLSRRPFSAQTGDAADQGRKPGSRKFWLLVPLPVFGMVAMGTFFGSTQTALIAFAGEFGAATSAGLLYAVMGLSSAAAALSVAYWPARFSASWRWIISAGGMSLLSLLLFLPQEVPLMLLVLFVLGIPVGPTMVTIFSIGSLVAPKELMGTVMTLLASGIVAGTAIGASVAGTLAEANGFSAAFAVPVAAAGALLVLGVVSLTVPRQRQVS